MSDSNKVIGQGAFGPEPARDIALGNLLREEVGGVPESVDWSALAGRISARIATHATSPWWAYASRWERRMVPIALAAGLAAAVALARFDESASTPLVSASSVATDIVSGGSIDDAASSFAHSITSAGEFSIQVPE